MKVLVFGSNGLVGSSLKSTLPNESIFDEIKFSNRADTNLFSYEDTSKTILNFKPDIIINAAAKVGGIYANNTQRTNFLLENLKININILESSTKLNSVKIINLGSSCIYPLNAPDPIKESYFMSGKLEPTNSPYAMAKLTAIELGNAIKTEFGHDVINLMPTNLYGPNDNFSKEDSHVIPGLIRRFHDAKTNCEDEVVVWGSGNPKREFLFSEDMASASIFIMNLKKEAYIDLIGQSSHINIGFGSDISIKELAQNISEVVGFKGKIIFDNSRDDGTPRKILDSSKLKSIGWEPRIKLKEGLNIAYNDFLVNIETLRM